MFAASYAKINLFLEVLGKRPDGYHEVNTVMSSIDLYDSIKYALTKKPCIKLWSNRVELESDDNLICQIASYLQSRYSVNRGVEIALEKRIPIAAGLGGGSSNAAVTLLILNKLWELNLCEADLHEIAARFGSDINFFLGGGTALARGRGESIVPLGEVEISHLLLVNPGLHISASEAYKLIDHGYPVQDWEPEAGLCKSINRLEPGIRKKYKVVDEILKTMEEYHPQKAIMSGSGSTCYAIFDGDEPLERCKSGFDQLGYWTHKTRTLTRKEYQKCFQN